MQRMNIGDGHYTERLAAGKIRCQRKCSILKLVQQKNLSYFLRIVLTFFLCTLLISIPIVLTVNSYQFPHMLLRFDEINVFIFFTKLLHMASVQQASLQICTVVCIRKLRQKYEANQNRIQN
jgi:hypothetical protein